MKYQQLNLFPTLLHKEYGVKINEVSTIEFISYLIAFIAHIVGISVHGKPRGVLVEPRPSGGDGLGLVEPLVLQPHHSFPFHVTEQVPDRL